MTQKAKTHEPVNITNNSHVPVLISSFLAFTAQIEAKQEIPTGNQTSIMGNKYSQTGNCFLVAGIQLPTTAGQALNTGNQSLKTGNYSPIPGDQRAIANLNDWQYAIIQCFRKITFQRFSNLEAFLSSNTNF